MYLCSNNKEKEHHLRGVSGEWEGPKGRKEEDVGGTKGKVVL